VLTALLGGLLVALTGLVPVPAQAVRRAEEQTPLTVTLSSMSPSSITPRKGGIVTLTGTVTNADDQTWHDITVYPFVSATPMTTTAELAEAADTDESVEVGGRILFQEADYARVGDIEPGATVRFTINLPRDDIKVTAPGVYWFGVHALDGADSVADGRARTFLPVVPVRTAPVRAAVLVPLRVHVTRNPDGSVASLGSWQRLLRAAGRLGRARSLGTAPGGRNLSWLVDPALLDALQQLAAGNPERDISPTEQPSDGSGDGDGSASASPTPTPTPSASASPGTKPDPQTQAVAALASDWLEAMVPVLKSSEVLALPYGDLDLSAAATHDKDVYETARTRSIAFFEALGVTARQVNAPARGVVSSDGLTMTDTATPMVLSDTAMPDDLGWGTEESPSVVSAGGWRIAVSSSEAASGGPGPGNPQADVALRQRILAEAAVRAISPSRTPLVVTLPERWRPDDPVGFATGLLQPWLQVSGLSTATAGQVAPEVDSKDLTYSASAERSEVPGDRFASAEALMRTGRSLQRVLTRNDTVASEVVDEALTDLGYNARRSVSDSAAASRGWMQTQLGQIQVQGPAGVTLSGGSGRFAATVVNALEEPVTVRLRAETGPGISVSAPKSVEIAPASRVTVLLDASDAQAGVHNVDLVVVDSDDERLGSSAQVPIRAAQVSKIIWLFLGVGGALLFGAIAVRLVRRVRAARS
jgi:hypothetical protein